jgi:hypothetical protein
MAGLALTGLLVVSVLTACGPSLHELQSILDEFQPPADWRLAATQTYGPGGDVDCMTGLLQCPHATRYYVATGTPQAAYAQLEQLAIGAGFIIDRQPVAPCDIPAGAAACEGKAARSDLAASLSVYADNYEFPNVQIDDRTGPIVAVTVWAP